MTEFFPLLQKTACYQIFKRDKNLSSLSHSYLLLSKDVRLLRDYLKIFACQMLCERENPCLSCRTCSNVLKETSPDVLIFPKKDNKTITAEDVDKIVEEAYVLPYENKIKLFILSNAETLNATCQNKLLKILEEPPKNVYFLLGASKEYSLLPTVLSRLKKLEIPTFEKDEILKVLEKNYERSPKLYSAVESSEGLIGKAITLYESESFNTILDNVFMVLKELKKSDNVLPVSLILPSGKEDFGLFLNLLKTALSDISRVLNKNDDLSLSLESREIKSLAKDFNINSIAFIIDKINEIEIKLNFNVNITMLIEETLFAILEGKFLWKE